MAILEKKFTTSFYEATYYVEESQAGMRLDQFLQIYLETWSRQDVKKKITDRDVVILKRAGKHRPSTILHYKEIVKLLIKKTVQEDEYWRGKLIPLQESPEIIFEDSDLIVISKPAYMATHPTGRHLFYCATVHFEEIHKKTIHSIHRLDRETSGVLLLGKNPKCSNDLTEEFINGRVSKCYFFISKIDPEVYQNSLIFEQDERLGPSEPGLKRVYINSYPKDSTDGKHAHTKYRILHIENGYALGLAFPQTGRQHQIRVHAKNAGLPLIGDKLYLGNFKMFQRFKDNIAKEEDHVLLEHHRHALHAIALKLNYKNERRVFTSKIPKDFIPWIRKNMSIDLDGLYKKIENEIKNF